MQDLLQRPQQVITIDGDLCAGKTTIADRLESLLSERNCQVVRFSTDMFLIDRDKRKYKENPSMLDLRNWFRKNDALPMLRTLFTAQSSCTLNFSVYDRSTGKMTKDVQMTYTPKRSILLLEGIYITEWVSLVHGSHALRLFLTVKNETSYSRMLKRNTYIPRARLEYEAKNIYFPAIARYHRQLADDTISFDYIADTSDFSAITWTQGQLH